MEDRRDNFEILLEMACKRCVEENCALFMNIDTTEGVISERERQKIKKIIEKACVKSD